MNAKTVCIVQARLSSSRLPRKILADIAGKPMLQHVIERVQKIKGVDEVVVACPERDMDAIVAEQGKWAGGAKYIKVAGVTAAESDVLRRFQFVARISEADVIVRITADCPLLDPDVCANVLDRFHVEHADFASNDTTESGYADGLDAQVMSRAILERAHAEAVTAYDREHVCSIMPRLGGVRVSLVRSPHDYSRFKFSVDTPEDLDRIREIMKALPNNYLLNDLIETATRTEGRFGPTAQHPGRLLEQARQER